MSEYLETLGYGTVTPVNGLYMNQVPLVEFIPIETMGKAPYIEESFCQGLQQSIFSWWSRIESHYRQSEHERATSGTDIP